MQFLASRPHMPGYGLAGPKQGGGLLPWSWAEMRLTRSHNYWLSTVTREGRPHTMAVWGVWSADSFLFSTGGSSRKARNLAFDPRCTVVAEDAAEAVIVEGTASLLTDRDQLEALAEEYQAKYDGGFPASSHVYRVLPEVVFGMIEASGQFTQTATRWKAIP